MKYRRANRNDIDLFVKNRIVSSCMAFIFHTVPKSSSPKGINAELLNVYTIKEYRRKGYAEKLISMLIQEVKNLGVEKIVLDYTDMGLPLYGKFGFTTSHKLLDEPFGIGYPKEESARKKDSNLLKSINSMIKRDLKDIIPKVDMGFMKKSY